MKNVHKHTIQGHQTKLLISSALELHMPHYLSVELLAWLRHFICHIIFQLHARCWVQAEKTSFPISPADTNSSHSTIHSHKKADGSSSNNDNGSSCKWSALWREYVRSETDVRCMGRASDTIAS